MKQIENIVKALISDHCKSQYACRECLFYGMGGYMNIENQKFYCPFHRQPSEWFSEKKFEMSEEIKNMCSSRDKCHMCVFNYRSSCVFENIDPDKIPEEWMELTENQKQEIEAIMNDFCDSTNCRYCPFSNEIGCKFDEGK